MNKSYKRYISKITSTVINNNFDTIRLPIVSVPLKEIDSVDDKVNVIDIDLLPNIDTTVESPPFDDIDLNDLGFLADDDE